MVLAATALLFALVFRGQLAAWLSIARCLLGFVVLALPYAGFLLVQLFRTRPPWRNEGIVAACLILMTVAAFDVGRVLNYPAGVPRDAVGAGWTVRSLQDTRTISADAKILIERSQDFGDLSIVALANRPERFVVLNELAYRQTALSGQWANRPAMLPELEGQGVRGTVCRDDFQDPACKDSVLRENIRSRDPLFAKASRELPGHVPCSLMEYRAVSCVRHAVGAFRQRSPPQQEAEQDSRGSNELMLSYARRSGRFVARHS